MTIPVNQNYVSNPSFRDGFEGWVGVDAILEPLATGGYETGPECMQVQKTDVAYSGIKASRFTSVNTRGVSSTYTASAYVNIPSGSEDGTLLLSILWYTSGKSYISSTDSTATAITDGSTWTRLTATGTPPATAGYAVVQIVQTTAGTAGAVFKVDAVKLEIGTSATPFEEFINQSQENVIVNRGLTPVPVPHISGMQLNADIELNDLVFNTIDNDGFTFVITDVTGVFESPEPESPEVSRGIYADGDYDVRGRYMARFINLTGSVLVPGPEYVTEARNKIMAATQLVKSGAWLKLKPKNEPVRAVFVRLNGPTQTTVVNPRGRIDFSIGLKAADPVIYEWNEDRLDGYSVANVAVSNYRGTEAGIVEVGNNGNYTVGAIYEIRGPLAPGASIFNYSNGDMLSFTSTIRPERYRDIYFKTMSEGVATLVIANLSSSTPDAHDYQVGDEIIVSLTSSQTAATVNRGSGNAYATITTASDGGFSNNDYVILSGVGGDLDGSAVQISNVSTVTFTVPSTNTTAYSNVSLVGALVTNITNQKFNGTQYITAIPNAYSVRYSTGYLETVSGAVTAQNKNIMRNTVYRDADYLEVDTLNNEVALNGNVYGARGYLDGLIDWVKLPPGNNEIELSDKSRTPLYVEKAAISASGTVTVFTSEPHGMLTGDVVHSDKFDALGVEASRYETRTRTDVTVLLQEGYTATLTATAHGLSTGNTVVITDVNRAVNGKRVVASTTTDTFTITSDIYQDVPRQAVAGYVKKITPVTYYSKSGDFVTIIANAHGFTTSDNIVLSGIDEAIDGEQTITNVPNVNAFSFYTTNRFPSDTISNTAASSNAQATLRYRVSGVNKTYALNYVTGNTGNLVATTNVGALAYTDNGGYSPIASVSRSNNITTVTTRTKHGYGAGDFVTLSGAGVSSIDGGSFIVGYGTPVQISSFTTSGNTITVIANAHGFITNDSATIYSVDTGVSGVDINGTYPITNVNVNAFSYIIDSALKLNYTPIASQLVNNVATLYLNEKPDFEATDQFGTPTKITVSNVGSPYDNAVGVTLSSVDVGNNSVSWSLTNANVSYATISSSTAVVGLYINQSPQRAFAHRRAEIVYYFVNADATASLTNTVAGRYAHIRTLANHGFVAGDTVEILNLSSIIDGVHTVQANTNADTFIVKIDNTAIVQRSTATALRTAGSTTITVTKTGHGLYPGDYIWFDSQTSLVADGKFQVKTVPNANAFTIRGVSTTANASATHYYYPLREDAYAVEGFPILDGPQVTDYTFSFRNPATNTNVTTTAVSSISPEIYLDSTAKAKIYYRSGWIG